MQGSIDDISTDLKVICQELKVSGMYESEKPSDAPIENQVRQFEGLIAAQDLRLRTFYKKRISEIKKIQDRRQRLQEVYLLMTRLQGDFDFSRVKTVPGALKVFLEKGYTGVGVYLSAVFALSVSSVARKGDLVPSLVAGQLPMSPSSQFVLSESLQRAAWVRVEVRDLTGVNLVMDLDPVLYPGQIIPLLPRKQPLKNRESFEDECFALQKCLNKKLLSEQKKVLE